MAEEPRKRRRRPRGVLARFRKRLNIKSTPREPKAKPPTDKPRNSYPTGGYSNPAPRRKRLQEVFDFGLRRKKD